jgi:hypothetical protein
VQTRNCRIGKARPCLRVLNKSTRAMSRGGCLQYEEKHALVSTPATLLPPAPLDKRRRAAITFSRYMHHLRIEARPCMVCNGLDDGRVDCRRGGGGNATKCTVGIVQRRLQKTDTSMWPACHGSQRQQLRPTIDGEDRREGRREEERKAGR